MMNAEEFLDMLDAKQDEAESAGRRLAHWVMRKSMFDRVVEHLNSTRQMRPIEKEHWLTPLWPTFSGIPVHVVDENMLPETWQAIGFDWTWEPVVVIVAEPKNEETT